METVEKTLGEHPEYINYAHIGLVAPLLGFAGFSMHKASQGDASATGRLKMLGFALMIIAVIILVFHGYRVWKHMETANGNVSTNLGVNAGVNAAANAAVEGYQRMHKK